jgi:hypothetical protein
MHSSLTGFLPGFSGCYPGETQKARFLANQEVTTWRGGCSGSSGFSGSSGDIKECGSESAYYLRLCILRLATRVRSLAHPIISLLAHPEEPEEPKQPRYPEEHRTLARHERELIRQLGVELDGERPERT